MKRRDFLKGALCSGFVQPRVEARSKIMQSGFRIVAPLGWRNFIDDNKVLKTNSPKIRLEIDKSNFFKIGTLNKNTNNSIEYVSDNSDDLWKLAHSLGDCEDFVLRKLYDLTVKYGYPRSLFSIATCWAETKRKHAVLVMHTINGDMILDSRFDHIALWSKLPYRWGVIEQHKGIDDYWHMIL